MTGRQRAGDRPSSRPHALWRTAIFYAAVAGEVIFAAAFAFCAIAPAYGLHLAMAKPGIAVSTIMLIACIAAIRLTGDDE